MKPSELKISISVESYDEKNAENWQNCYLAEIHIVSEDSKFYIQLEVMMKKLSKITEIFMLPEWHSFQTIKTSISNFDCTN